MCVGGKSIFEPRGWIERVWIVLSKSKLIRHTQSPDYLLLQPPFVEDIARGNNPRRQRVPLVNRTRQCSCQSVVGCAAGDDKRRYIGQHIPGRTMVRAHNRVLADL